MTLHTPMAGPDFEAALRDQMLGLVERERRARRPDAPVPAPRVARTRDKVAALMADGRERTLADVANAISRGDTPSRSSVGDTLRRMVASGELTVAQPAGSGLSLNIYRRAADAP